MADEKHGDLLRSEDSEGDIGARDHSAGPAPTADDGANKRREHPKAGYPKAHPLHKKAPYRKGRKDGVPAVGDGS